MYFLVYAVLVLLAAGISSVFYEGVKDRRAAREAGGQIGSLWWHVQEYMRKDEERRKSKKRKGETTPSEMTAELRSSLETNRAAAKEAVSSKRWKQKARSLRDQNPPESPGFDQAALSSHHRDSTPSSEYASSLTFAYTDSQGRTSVRDIVNWRFDGTYIKGYCIEQEDVRTFRRDRIEYFLYGEEFLDQRRTDRPMNPMDKRLFDTEMEILFTGFSADDRDELENTASEIGLVVRKTVTKNLTFVCAGPRAGATKLRQAEERGAVVLNADQFHHLLETGEVPA